MPKKFDHSNSLRGQLLIATNALDGSFFEKSVVYICAHDETGAMGVAINRAMGDVKCSDILEQLSVEAEQIRFDASVYLGGPVDATRGFIIHTSDYECDGTNPVRDNISVTGTVDILKDIAFGKGPGKSLVALGYSGWSAGQLEKEIIENSWFSAPANEDLLFHMKNDEKWEATSKLIGVNFATISGQMGNA